MFTYLSVGDADEPLVYQFVRLGVSGLSLHDVTLCRLVGQGDGWNLGRGGIRFRFRFRFNFIVTVQSLVQRQRNVVGDLNSSAK